MELVQAFDLIDATQNLDPFVAVSGAIKACAVTLVQDRQRFPTDVLRPQSRFWRDQSAGKTERFFHHAG